MINPIKYISGEIEFIMCSTVFRMWDQLESDFSRFTHDSVANFLNNKLQPLLFPNQCIGIIDKAIMCETAFHVKVVKFMIYVCRETFYKTESNE